MPCYSPLQAWRSREINPSGRRGLVFSPKGAQAPDDPLEIACGQCIGCRLERSRQWAVRCVHEASLYEDNCFITLTFNEESLKARENPKSLDVSDFQKFMKRLRKRYGKNIRFFHCGEYGDKYGRPHYHACIFNHDFDDRRLYSVRDNVRLYTSESLAELWPFGFSSVGDVTFDSAAYVARYIMKKITGEHAWHHYSEIDYETGEIINPRKPEYTTMSRRPGIGKGWYDLYKNDLYPHDRVVCNGAKMNVPKFYDKQLEKENPYQLEDLKAERVEKAKVHQDDNTPERLRVKEKIKQSKLNMLPRKVG